MLLLISLLTFIPSPYIFFTVKIKVFASNSNDKLAAPLCLFTFGVLTRSKYEFIELLYYIFIKHLIKNIYKVL